MAFRPDTDFPPETRGKPWSCLTTLATAATVRRLTKHRRLIDGLRRSAADDRSTAPASTTRPGSS